MACLFHYDLSIANVMRCVGNKNTDNHQKITQRLKYIRGLVNDYLLALYAIVMLTGAPVHFVTESREENIMIC